MKSKPSDRTDPSKGHKRPRGSFWAPMAATMKQTLQTTPLINKLVPGGRPPVTRLYPYEKIELPASFRGQHVIDWYRQRTIPQPSLTQFSQASVRLRFNSANPPGFLRQGFSAPFLEAALNSPNQIVKDGFLLSGW